MHPVFTFGLLALFRFWAFPLLSSDDGFLTGTVEEDVIAEGPICATRLLNQISVTAP
jgi:hypothetical protein